MSAAENTVQVEQLAVPVDDEKELSPKAIVAELDRFIIAQHDAKRAVAVALRNRWRRLRVPEKMREEITPKNIIMIGPTGVGKTEISRRLAKLAGAPFVKVEASKFTEVGYVGRDVESIIRDLVENAYHLAKEDARIRNRARAEKQAEEKLLDILLPDSSSDENGSDSRTTTRERLRELLKEGKLNDRMVEIELEKPSGAHLEIMGPQGFAEVEGQLKDMLSNMIPKGRETRRVRVEEAEKLLTAEAQEELIDQDEVARTATRTAEQSGIVFIDEIDKVSAGPASQKGPDVSREGVQRDLLPLVEGCTVSTKYGTVKTDHVLFIASGAFHQSKPSDLMPEFQGRFPIRVELTSLNAEHFFRILTEPQNALTKQYIELLKTEGVELEFREDAVEELSRLTAEVNSKTENIGARRLHTLLEKVLEDLSFSADEMQGQSVCIDRAYVEDRLKDIVQDLDLSRFIL